MSVKDVLNYGSIVVDEEEALEIEYMRRSDKTLRVGINFITRTVLSDGLLKIVTKDNNGIDGGGKINKDLEQLNIYFESEVLPAIQIAFKQYITWGYFAWLFKEVEINKKLKQTKIDKNLIKRPFILDRDQYEIYSDEIDHERVWKVKLKKQIEDVGNDREYPIPNMFIPKIDAPEFREGKHVATLADIVSQSKYIDEMKELYMTTLQRRANPIIVIENDNSNRIGLVNRATMEHGEAKFENDLADSAKTTYIEQQNLEAEFGKDEEELIEKFKSRGYRGRSKNGDGGAFFDLLDVWKRKRVVPSGKKLASQPRPPESMDSYLPFETYRAEYIMTLLGLSGALFVGGAMRSGGNKLGGSNSMADNDMMITNLALSHYEKILRDISTHFMNILLPYDFEESYKMELTSAKISTQEDVYRLYEEGAIDKENRDNILWKINYITGQEFIEEMEHVKNRAKINKILDPPDTSKILKNSSVSSKKVTVKTPKNSSEEKLKVDQVVKKNNSEREQSGKKRAKSSSNSNETGKKRIKESKR